MKFVVVTGRGEVEWLLKFGAESIVEQFTPVLFGDYKLFSSKIYSEIEINILKAGFKILKNEFVAEDLAYILHDKGLHKESIKYFQ